MSNAPTVYGYHAHVYYDTATLPVAEKLKAELVARYAGQAGARYDAAPGISRGAIAESGLTRPARE